MERVSVNDSQQTSIKLNVSAVGAPKVSNALDLYSNSFRWTATYIYPFVQIQFIKYRSVEKQKL